MAKKRDENRTANERLGEQEEEDGGLQEEEDDTYMARSTCDEADSSQCDWHDHKQDASNDEQEE